MERGKEQEKCKFSDKEKNLREKIDEEEEEQSSGSVFVRYGSRKIETEERGETSVERKPDAVLSGFFFPNGFFLSLFLCSSLIGSSSSDWWIYVVVIAAIVVFALVLFAVLFWGYRKGWFRKLFASRRRSVIIETLWFIFVSSAFTPLLFYYYCCCCCSRKSTRSFFLPFSLSRTFFDYYRIFYSSCYFLFRNKMLQTRFALVTVFFSFIWSNHNLQLISDNKKKERKNFTLWILSQFVCASRNSSILVVWTAKLDTGESEKCIEQSRQKFSSKWFSEEWNIPVTWTSLLFYEYE